MPPHLSVVLPMHNEARNAGAVIGQFAEVLGRLGISHEVIAVDDGSTDDTPNVLQNIKGACPQLRTVTHAANVGYGAALRSGFHAAQGEYFFFTDADGQFGPFELAEFLKVAAPKVMVVGYRVARADRRVRRWNAWLWRVLIDSLFRLRVRDIDCAYKLFPRKLVAEQALVADGAFINVELFLRARGRGYRIRELPVSHARRKTGASSGARPAVVARAFRELVSYLLSKR